jgi:hypothetical protein
MSWASQTTTQAVSKESLLEIIKAEVSQELEALLERQRAHLCCLIYGDAKTGKSGLALDCRTTDEIDDDAIVMVLDFDNGCEPTWRTNWSSDPNIKILNPIGRDEEGFPDLDRTVRRAEAFIVIAKDYMEEGKTVKFVFDGCDRWLRLCWYAMGIDKRATEVKQMPMKWGKRNTEYENLIEKITDGLECDRYFITHMKDEYAHNNPNPIGRVVNIKESTMDKMNQVIEVKTTKIGNKQTSTATVVASKTNTELVGKSFDFLTIDDGEVTWDSIEQLQKGEL